MFKILTYFLYAYIQYFSLTVRPVLNGAYYRMSQKQKKRKKKEPDSVA